MYSDDVWGRSGPDAVINITEPVKIKRLQMVDEIKRALEVAENVPFRYLIQHLGVAGEEFDERKIDCRLRRARRNQLVRPPARRRGAARKYAQRALERRTAACIFRSDPSELECLSRRRPRQHEGRRRDGVSNSEASHPLDARSRQQWKGRLAPFPSPEGSDGTIDWPRAMDALRSLDAGCPLLLELREVPAMEHPLDVVRKTFDDLEKLTTAHES